MKKVLETSKGKWQVVEINTYQEGQYYVDTIGSFHYKLSKITEEEAKSIVSEELNEKYLLITMDWYRYKLNTLLESQGIEITQNTYIFKVN